MVIMLVLVLDTFLGNLAKHMVAFAHAVPSFHLLLLLFLRDGLAQFVAILLLVCRLLYLFVRLVTLVRLSLTLNYSTPLIEIALRIPRVVPLVVIGELLKLLSFIFQGLFHALAVQF